jgi:hypothetical protein
MKFDASTSPGIGPEGPPPQGRGGGSVQGRIHSAPSGPVPGLVLAWTS